MKQPNYLFLIGENDHKSTSKLYFLTFSNFRDGHPATDNFHQAITKLRRYQYLINNKLNFVRTEYILYIAPAQHTIKIDQHIAKCNKVTELNQIMELYKKHDGFRSEFTSNSQLILGKSMGYLPP